VTAREELEDFGVIEYGGYERRVVANVFRRPRNVWCAE
jgi:hypothetical protein